MFKFIKYHFNQFTTGFKQGFKESYHSAYNK